MKSVTAKELNQELNSRTPKELRELCLRLARFKKENKELLSYLLFDSSDETVYIEGVKNEIDEQFEQINRKSYYTFKKGISKILRNTRKYIRYSQKKRTEVELLIWFCTKLNKLTPSIHKNTGLMNLYKRQLDTLIKKISALHEDLQFDYETDLKELSNSAS